jgi:hypothetical protein
MKKLEEKEAKKDEVISWFNEEYIKFKINLGIFDK